MWGTSMMGSHTTGNGMWWGLTSAVFWIAVVALVTFAAVYLFSQLQHGDALREHREDSAITILRERFAQGEISREQYELIRRTLEGQNSQHAEDTR